MTEREIIESVVHFDNKLSAVNGKRRIPIEVAYGYSLCRNDDTTPKELFRNADRNMYERKQRMKEKTR